MMLQTEKYPDTTYSQHKNEEYPVTEIPTIIERQLIRFSVQIRRLDSYEMQT